MFIFKVYILF